MEGWTDGRTLLAFTSTRAHLARGRISGYHYKVWQPALLAVPTKVGCKGWCERVVYAPNRHHQSAELKANGSPKKLGFQTRCGMKWQNDST